MVPEAPLERHGAAACGLSGEGWFVVNARDAALVRGDELGLYTMFDSEDARFEQVGVNIGILRPGEPNCMYHAEDAQEDFLVLSGECLLIVEGEERRSEGVGLRALPADDGARLRRRRRRPVRRCRRRARGGRGERSSTRSTRRRCSTVPGVEEETSEPSVAYARFAEDAPIPCPKEFPAG